VCLFVRVILHIALCFVNWFLNVVHDPVDGDVNIGHDHIEMQRNDGLFSAIHIHFTIMIINFCLWQILIHLKNARWRCNG
jgi:hypothetical protein